MLEIADLLSRLLACRRSRSFPPVVAAAAPSMEMMRKARARARATSRHARDPAIDELREIYEGC